MSIELEPIIGRYTTIEIAGKRCRVYFEEAGSGIPLLCMHTAGADNRQFRHIMNDSEITKNFRVIAFDMPWHGKSYPPEGWENEEYRLSTDLYVDTIMSFARALDLKKPVGMGCSIGGRISLQLANLHSDYFRALIGLEAADFQKPWYDTAWLNRGDVHGGEVCAALVSGLIAPQSPKKYRHETLWQYMQSGPGIFRGDLYFYRVDGDLRNKLGGIRTDLCPLYLMTGEYDFSCTPEDTVRTAQSIQGAKVTIMKEVGHFPMSENPDKFKQYLMPVLSEIITFKN
jgi:pimeloyl-ACP methyl ester carboxylesterase